MSTLENMSKMGVKADMETLEQYSLKFCNLSEPELFIQKMQDIGYTVKEVFTSICVVLLTQHELEKVENLCKMVTTNQQQIQFLFKVIFMTHQYLLKD